MPAQHVKPALSADSFNCPRCKALAAQPTIEIFSLTDEEGELVISDGQPSDEWSTDPDTVAAFQWRVTKCYACKKHSLWIGDSLAYPPARAGVEAAVDEPNEDLPPNVLELYEEAAAVLPYSKRAAAALCRAALERLVKHLTPEAPPTLKLQGRLDTLRTRVSSSTLKALSIVRHTGNTALHGEKDGDQSAVIYLDENDETIASVFFVAINTLADELITKPRVLDELYQTLPEGVRKSVDADSGQPQS